MPGGSARFVLADGEILSLAVKDLRRVYALLWEVAEVSGSISAAALVLDTALRPEARGHSTELRVAQTKALRQAVSRLSAEL
jgi:hypothetical protein